MQTLLDATTTKFTVGGVAMWSGQFVKAWSKTMGVLALSGVRIGSGGEGSHRRYGTAVNFERLLFVWPRGN